ncbi:translation initiation factor IF-2 [Thraustotheca clavata]|uniref:Translation initiation factor IF-2 n=1 Tax=Thraustotheca clavata TaxID=74557 RepID=A0A1V9ZN94_9STRA|nr:translation initiation factor IF-2 [Thraustotheca clavata]
MAAQVRAFALIRGFSSSGNGKRWVPKPRNDLFPSKAHVAGLKKTIPRATTEVKDKAPRQTWDMNLKQWVPYVEEKKKVGPRKTAEPNATATRWLKKNDTKSAETPRFRLFDQTTEGELKINVPKINTAKPGEKHTTRKDWRHNPQHSHSYHDPKKKAHQHTAAQKALHFEKSLFDFEGSLFPDIDWNSRQDARNERKKFQSRHNSAQRSRTAKNQQMRKREIEAHLKDMKVEIPATIVVSELADRTCVKSFKLLRVLRGLGEKVNEDSVITAEVAELAVEEMGMIPVLLQGFVDLTRTPIPDDCSAFPTRPPVVSVMGHVDHGKTTLLDALRNTSTKEHGGITQSIGAFTVPIAESPTPITFFDTPGHAAFATMRSQGCHLTDILVVVVAADDGIRPQTKEVLELAQEHDLPIIVAITKCDRYPDEEDEVIERITEELELNGIEAHDTQLVCVSGKTGQGLDELKQAIILQAELMDLRADTKASGEGVVVEATIVRGWGTTVDMMVTWGTVKVGQYVVCGLEYGKIKSLVDQNGKSVKEATPSTPVRMVGLKELPKTGDSILPVDTEERAKEVISERARIQEQIQMKEIAANSPEKKEHIPIARRQKARQLEFKRQERALEEKRLENLTMEDEDYVKKIVPIILKTNSLGVIDAIDTLIKELNDINEECELKRIHGGVGPVTSSDLDLAARAGATIFTFNTRSPNSIDKDAQRKKIDIRTHNVVYSLVDDIESVVTQQMTPVLEDQVLGSAEILQVISINTKGRSKVNIAGSRVTDGSLFLDCSYRVLRQGQVIAEDSKLESMHHYQEKISESTKGQECGLQFTQDINFQQGDVLQAYKTNKVPPKLQRD